MNTISTEMSITILILLVLTILVILFLLIKIKKESKRIYEKYRDIIDVEKEIEKQEKKSQLKLNELNNKHQKIKQNIEIDKNRAIDLLKIKDELELEVSLLEEDQSLQDFGYYKPNYFFDSSEEYKEDLDIIKEDLKNLIKDKMAAFCTTEWIVEGSKAKGKAKTNDNLKLMIRAFNGECDSAISNVKYNNVHVMEKRIKKSFEMINKINKREFCKLSEEFLDLKLQELYLTHEYYEKKQEEKEEQKRIKQQIREEEKAQKEFEKAKFQAQKEEEQSQKALEKARKELEEAHGDKVNKLKARIELMEANLKEAQEKNKRATSMAQLTKSGHVYVISNIGSFGQEFYKIGMTRRLEPIDRIKELSNASVPFRFDVHAMIYSENAPELEKQLHKEFTHKRINKVNNRKEFFNVSFDEIKNTLLKTNGETKITKLAEAKEYRETLMIEKEMNTNKIEKENLKEADILSI